MGILSNDLDLAITGIVNNARVTSCANLMPSPIEGAPAKKVE